MLIVTSLTSLQRKNPIHRSRGEAFRKTKHLQLQKKIKGGYLTPKGDSDDEPPGFVIDSSDDEPNKTKPTKK